MYCYTYDKETGGIVLNENHLQFSKEPRPVYSREMDILGFDKRWKYEKQDDAPYMWAESNAYWYRGELVAKTHGGSLYDLPTVEYVTGEDETPILPEGEQLIPVDIPAMVEKNAGLISVLEQSTVQKIYDVYRRYRKRLDCFHVAFSGGKDSVVLLDLVKKALPPGSFVVVFGDTGMEFPDTYDVVDKVEAQCKAEGINFYRAASHFKPEESWKIFGPPSRDLRWCCSVHKSVPQVLKLREIIGKTDYKGLAFVGVRAHESLSRSGYEYENFGKKSKGQYSHNSILEWNSGEVWLYIYKNKLVINEAYKKGNTRAGCLLCPMGRGKSDGFRYINYPLEIKRFSDIICDTVNPDAIIDYNSYIENGGWASRGSGRDLLNNEPKYEEKISGNKLIITIKNTKNIWNEWIKTYDVLSLNIKINQITDGYQVEIDNFKNNQNQIKIIKQVFLKSAYCIGCRACEAMCPYGSISFQHGLKITDCKQCGNCHTINYGCYVADSLKIPVTTKKMVNLNTFEEHAPKLDWVKDFFQNGKSFISDNSLGKNQNTKFKRFLSNAGLIQSQNTTSFFETIKNIGWETATAWGLILVNLIYDNPQIKWYVQNMSIDTLLTKKEMEALLSDQSRPSAIVSAFGRLCNIPLGTELHFGEVTEKGKHIDTLCRTKCVVTDPRVILYALYKFAEACEGYYQFSLSRLMDFNVESAGVSPAQIFGLDRDEMEASLNGLSAAYPEFINATFTHDLDKITLREGKTSEDVLRLFD